MHFDLDCAESFMILTQERHYRRAAARLHMSSPALTKRIQRLERQLQVQLLERGPTGVLSLTAAGIRLSAELGPLLAHEARVREITQGHRLTLVMGVPHDGAAGAPLDFDMAAIQRRVRREHPGTTVTCRRVPLPLMTAWLVDGHVDIQLTAGRVEHAAVESAPLASVVRVAAVPRDSELADADALRVEDIADQPMLYDPWLPTAFMRSFWLGDILPNPQAPLIPIVARDSRTVMEHVVRGVGVTILLQPQQTSVPPGIRVLPLLDAPPLVLHAARRTDDRRASVRALVDALQQTPTGTD